MTHPFHPLCGREFVVVKRSYAWREERVYYEDDKGRLVSLPGRWTSLADTDIFLEVSAGRSLLHFDDLVRLSALVAELIERGGGR